MAQDKIYVVVGASRGLGLELVSQLLDSDSTLIVAATARDPDGASELKQLADKHTPRLQVFKLDTSSETSIQEAASAVATAYSSGIDTLIINAGKAEVYTLALDTSAEVFRDILNVNTVGPFLAAKSFYPQLQKRQTKTIVVISSALGSVGNRHATLWKTERLAYHKGALAYSASKAALNMVTAALANQLQPEGFIVVALHPGHVDTDMGSRNEHLFGKAPLSPAESVAGQIKVINQLTVKDTGRFLSHTGNDLPY